MESPVSHSVTEAQKARQEQLEEDAKGFSLIRVVRQVAGQKPAELIELGVEHSDEDEYSYHHMMATELPRVAERIAEKRAKTRGPTKDIYRALELCGDDLVIAAVALKTIFDELISHSMMIDFPEDIESINDFADTDGLLQMRLAGHVGDALRALFDSEHVIQKSKKSNRNGGSSKKTKPEVDLAATYFDDDKRCVTVGLYVVTLCIENSHYFEYAPKIKQRDGYRVRLKNPEKIVSSLAKKNMVPPFWTPLVIPPRPWKSISDGGYHYSMAKAASFINSARNNTTNSAESCPDVFHAVNRLQNTPFRISQPVFNVFSILYNTVRKYLCRHLHEPEAARIGGESASEEDKRLNYRSERLLKIPTHFLRHHATNVSRQNKRETLAALLNIIRLYDEAAKFCEEERIYFVNYCDFRGRVYQASSYLSTYRSDISRSMLEFADGKTIAGDNARKWLAIHGANCYAEKINGIGRDKAPFRERLAWVDENEDRIMELGRFSGEFDSLPKELEDWWLKADKPWAFLAWVHEWKSYRENPHSHVSHLPIDVDGSCNGYQHIAALLKSNDLGKQVNLLPGDRPMDIYSLIGGEAEKILAGYFSSGEHKDDLVDRYIGYHEKYTGIKGILAEFGAEHIGMESKPVTHKEDPLRPFSGESAPEALQTRAEVAENILKGGYRIFAEDLWSTTTAKERLPRRGIKKAIMTYPYSATLRGMTKDLQDDELHKRWRHSEPDTESQEEHVYMDLNDTLEPQQRFVLSWILCEVIRKAIQGSFPVVDALLGWFGTVARTVAMDGNVIHWSSPTGFIVCQDYRKENKIKISALGKRFVYYEKLEEQNPRKHQSALAPNFIHSCDAAHMMRTVNAAFDKGIRSFRIIHDSYATHASDMDTLSAILREEFVKMYSETDLLGKFVQDLTKNTGTTKPIHAPPVENTLYLDQVKKSKYFFA